jgi:hypothetical protein
MFDGKGGLALRDAIGRELKLSREKWNAVWQILAEGKSSRRANDDHVAASI